MKLFSMVGKLLHPPARPEVAAVQESSQRVISASEEFSKHSDALAKMVQKMKGPKPKRQKRAKP